MLRLAHNLNVHPPKWFGTRRLRRRETDTACLLGPTQANAPRNRMNNHLLASSSAVLSGGSWAIV